MPRPQHTGKPKSTAYTFRVTPKMMNDLRAVQSRDGISLSEQIRRGIKLWLMEKSK